MRKFGGRQRAVDQQEIVAACAGFYKGNGANATLTRAPPAERDGALENGRGFQLLEQFLLFAVAAFDIELQADVLAGVAGDHVLHQAMMPFEDAVDLVADFFDAAAGDFVAGDQELEIEGLFQMAEKESASSTIPVANIAVA